MHAYYGTLYVKNIHFSRRIKKRSKQILEFVSKWKLLPPCVVVFYTIWHKFRSELLHTLLHYRINQVPIAYMSQLGFPISRTFQVSTRQNLDFS